MDRTAAFYSQPSYVQRGAGFPVYSGARRQRGGSVLGALKNFMMPIVQNVKRNVARHGKREAWNMAKGVAWDAFRGRNVGDSIKKRGAHGLRQLGKNVLTDAADAIGSSPGPTPTRKRKAPTVSRKRKAPAVSRKRRKAPLQRLPLRKKRKVLKNF